MEGFVPLFNTLKLAFKFLRRFLMNPFLYILILVICGFKNPLLWEGCCTCVAKQNTKTLNKREAQNLALFSNISEDCK